MRKFLLIVIMFFTVGFIQAQVSKVTGTVLDSETGKPVPMVVVSIGELKTTTDEKGVFELLNVPNGNATITFTNQNYEVFTSLVTIKDGENKIASVNMKPILNTEGGGLSEVNLSTLDFDDDNKGQNVSGLLHSSNDVFTSTASFTFSAAYFKVRGYDSENSLTYMNNILVNDAENGRTSWSDWGGLNEATRNKESINGLSASDFSFGGIGGVTNIDTRASHYRKQNKLSYAFTNKAYTHRLMYTLSTGLMKNNWAFTVSGSKRFASEGYVQGTFYDAYAFFGAAEKKINEKHSIAFTFYGAPTKRGTQAASTKEVYELTNNNYYNANWGYQNGQKRNARIKTTNEPTFILNHYWKMDEKTKLTTSLGYSFSKNGYTALNWYNAADPRPDYYRYLPSGQTYISFPNPPDPIVVSAINEAWKNDANTNQINWDRMYQINYMTNSIGNQAVYIVENRHNDQNQISFNTFLNKEMNEHLSITEGIELRKYTSQNYKTIEDLLGGQYWMDIDQYSQRDYASDTNGTSVMQNDLNNPNRIVKKGDVFGYNYNINQNTALLWGQAEFTYNKIDFFFAANASGTQFWREGKIKNGINPNTSYGNSEKKTFVNYAVKGGVTYKITGHHYIVGNLAYISKPPLANDAFISSRVKNTFISGLTSETDISGDISYVLKTPFMNVRITAFQTIFKDQLDIVHYYSDDYHTYVNCSMTGVDKTHQGIELGSEIKETKTVSLIAVGAWGNYRYASRPTATISWENGLKPDKTETIYQKYFYVPGPQIAGSFGIKYANPKFWWVNVNFNYFDKMHLAFSPVRRTTETVTQSVLSESDVKLITEQEKLEGGYTIDASISKNIRLKKKININLNLSVNNILDNQNLITGGYEQTRESYARGNLTQFSPKYFYGYGRTYFLSVAFRI